MVRWWAKKYRQPLKGFEEHTWEELFIEQLEDFYAANPVEAERFLHEVGQRRVDDDDWDGTVPDEEENARRARGAQVKESGHVDLSKYQKDGDKKFSSAEVAQIMDNLGRNLPGSKVQKSAARQARQEPQTIQALGGEEFEDVF